jgi:hypothetical protein
MLIDMIHDNHGEPPFKTRYRDPAVLRELGYEAIVIPDALAVVPGAFDPQEAVGTRREGTPANIAPRRPRELEEAIDTQVRRADELGMKVYFYGDALLLPLSVVSRHPAEFYCDDNSGRLCPGKPAVLAALQEQVEALFDRWPGAAGLVMRTGEVYPEATPHMVGSPLHAGNCPTCRDVPTIDRLVRFITAMHDTVIRGMGKQYIHRAWTPSLAGLPTMHDDPAVYREVSSRVPVADGLHFSFKFTRGDFRQNPAAAGGGAGPGGTFNPCLFADERPKWVEFQCEREYEGKGAFPNYQGPAWRDFFAHLAAGPGGNDPKRFSVWGWSRGGGWGGPYVQREEWIDVNVGALAALYRQRDADPAEIASAWVASTFGVPESSPPAPAITELLMLSARAIRKLLYVAPLAGRGGRGGGNGELPWVKDDVLDVEAVYVSATRAVELGMAEEAVTEKREALEIVDRIQRLFDIAAPELPNKSQARDLTNALGYFASFAGTVAHLFMGFVRYARWVNTGRTDSDVAHAAVEHLQSAEAQWQLHTQRYAVLPGSPTMFHEHGLWERTNACLIELT